MLKFLLIKPKDFNCNPSKVCKRYLLSVEYWFVSLALIDSAQYSEQVFLGELEIFLLFFIILLAILNINIFLLVLLLIVFIIHIYWIYYCRQIKFTFMFVSINLK